MIRNVLILAGFCLILAVTLGFLIWKPRVPVSAPTRAGNPSLPAGVLPRVGQVTPDQLKSMADKQAQPLLAQLQSKPSNPELLAKLGYIYYRTQNYREAATYYKRSVDLKDDVIVRTELGRAYFYAGDPDSALAEFEKVLKSDPGNANALFNVGMVKWQIKSDVDGAVAAWQQILKNNPQHPRRTEVEQLIARAMQHRAMQQPMRTGAPAR